MRRCEDCGRTPVHARGLCQRCYVRMWRRTAPDRPERCEAIVDGEPCGKPVYARGKMRCRSCYDKAAYWSRDEWPRCVCCGKRTLAAHQFPDGSWLPWCKQCRSHALLLIRSLHLR